MIFARFVEKKSTDGNFTPGKLYILSESYVHSATKIGKLAVTDDDGNSVHVDPDKGEFIFPDIVYGVWVGLPMEKIKTGEVFAIEDVDNDAYRIKDNGYMMAVNFELLDLTNLCPGMYVQEIDTGIWKKISSVSGNGYIAVDGDKRHEPILFKFAVSNGRIVSYPMLFCINNTGVDSLTEGNVYYAKESHKNILKVTDDNGVDNEYDADRFSFDCCKPLTPEDLQDS